MTGGSSWTERSTTSHLRRTRAIRHDCLFLRWSLLGQARNAALLPIAWAIDPLLAERFPALFDFYASTATQNDTFIAGTAGAGYVFLNQLSKKQLQVYGNRVGALISQYGPNVIDTYGYANLTVHENYRQAIIAGGSSPDAFVTQPNWPNVAYSPFHCSNNSNMVLPDGTPLICTSGQA